MSVGLAAKISVIPQSSEQALVVVQGDLLPSDVKQFKEATSFFQKQLSRFKAMAGAPWRELKLASLFA
jgi:hypothetical protein